MGRPRLYQLLSHAQHRLKKHADATCRDELGISATQLGVLLTLDQRDGQPLSALADALGVNKSAMTRLAERLLEHGLVERRASATDARISELHLSERGVDLLHRGRALERRLTRELTDGFTDDEIDTVARFLIALTERTSR